MGSDDKIRRDSLPIPDRAHVGLTTYDAKDPATKFPPIRDIRPPKGAPNVLVILLDDVGYGATSVYGGPCHTPNFEKLAAGGLKYTRFHTTALCSPTRQALLTGRNHHSVGMGGITEIATAAPGYSSVLPNTKAPLALTLKLNGYSTAQFGKCHEVPVWQTSPAGPFNAWPTGGGGFEYFYGFIGGENNQWDPALYEGTTPIEPPKTPAEGYHLTEDLTDKAIAWTRQQKALMGDKPFFMYFAPGATHAPHQVPKEWIAKYKGKFSHGWDKQREIIFKRQKELGVIAPDSVLTPRHKEIPAWDEMDPKLKPALEREMEVYAAFMEHTDHHVGRLIDALKDMGVLDDTLIYLILGDNGASAEGTLQGAFNEMANFNGRPDLETPEFMMSKLDEFGGENSYGHYAVGWAWAMNSPYQWTKQVASHWGGTRNGTVVHWPSGIKEKGGIRNQFSHVIDLAPTVLEAAGIPEPTAVNGVQQSPYEGTSMLYSFNDAKAAERHETQYFEMFCNRGIYHKGWSAVTKHRTPWMMGGQKMPAFDDDVWELYDGSKDWTQSEDLSKRMPEKLHELQRLWLIEAVKYNVLPLDDRQIERFVPEMAGRPTLIKGNSQRLFAGMGRLSENSVVTIKNKSFAVTSEVEVPAKGAEGVIIAQGGRFGGWSLYARGGKAKFHYNVLGIKSYAVEATRPIPSGKTQVRMEFKYDGGGLGKGGTVTLYCDGKEVGKGRVEQTQGIIFSADETTDVGYESGTIVSPDYTAHTSRFNGRINWVKINLDKDAGDADHLFLPRSGHAWPWRGGEEKGAPSWSVKRRLAMRLALAGGLALAAFLGGPQTASATEGGASYYFPGSLGSFAVAVAPEPGFMFANQLLIYGAELDRAVLQGRVNSNLDAFAVYNMLMPAYTFSETALGGRVQLLAFLPVAYSKLEATVTGPLIGTRRETASDFNIGDGGLYPAIHWTFGDFHIKLAEMIMVPTGHYDSGDTVNVGRNYWAFDTQLGLTWLNSKTGTEVSLLPGIMLNMENSATDYQSGDEFHLDFMLNQFLSTSFAVGFQGYWYQQVSGDSGSGARLGDFKGESVGVGFGLLWLPEFAKGKLSIVGKWLHDLDATNRLEADYGQITIGYKF